MQGPGSHVQIPIEDAASLPDTVFLVRNNKGVSVLNLIAGGKRTRALVVCPSGDDVYDFNSRFPDASGHPEPKWTPLVRFLAAAIGGIDSLLLVTGGSRFEREALAA